MKTSAPSPILPVSALDLIELENQLVRLNVSMPAHSTLRWVLDVAWSQVPERRKFPYPKSWRWQRKLGKSKKRARIVADARLRQYMATRPADLLSACAGGAI